MFTRDDLVDAVMRHLGARGSSLNIRAPGLSPDGPPGRLFLTELDIKKRLTPGQTRLTIPPHAIVSPLAHDWLILNGITVVRE